MGLIKKLFGGIFALLGGTLGFFGKVLGIGKSKYFLELDDANMPASSNTQQANRASATAPEPQQSATATKPASIDATVPATGSKTSSKANSKASPKAESKANSKVESKQSASQTEAESQSAAHVTPPSRPQPVLTTFAPNFMLSVSSQNGRRRPGANMAMYLDMAKQMSSSSGRA